MVLNIFLFSILEWQIYCRWSYCKTTFCWGQKFKTQNQNYKMASMLTYSFCFSLILFSGYFRYFGAFINICSIPKITSTFTLLNCLQWWNETINYDEFSPKNIFKYVLVCLNLVASADFQITIERILLANRNCSIKHLVTLNFGN